MTKANCVVKFMIKWCNELVKYFLVHFWRVWSLTNVHEKIFVEN